MTIAQARHEEILLEGEVPTPLDPVQADGFDLGDDDEPDDIDDPDLEQEMPAATRAIAFSRTEAQLIQNFLTAWSEKRVQDTNTILLDRYVATTVREALARQVETRAKRGTAPAPAAAPAAPPDTIIAGFLKAFEDGDARALASTHGQRIAAYAKRVLREALEARTPPNSDPGLTVEAYRAMEEEVERAHAWRFHLEDKAREVLKRARVLAAARRAPTEAEFRAMLDLLTQAVRWAP